MDDEHGVAFHHLLNLPLRLRSMMMLGGLMSETGRGPLGPSPLHVALRSVKAGPATKWVSLRLVETIH